MSGQCLCPSLNTKDPAASPSEAAFLACAQEQGEGVEGDEWPVLPISSTATVLAASPFKTAFLACEQVRENRWREISGEYFNHAPPPLFSLRRPQARNCWPVCGGRVRGGR